MLKKIAFGFVMWSASAMFVGCASTEASSGRTPSSTSASSTSASASPEGASTSSPDASAEEQASSTAVCSASEGDRLFVAELVRVIRAVGPQVIGRPIERLPPMFFVRPDCVLELIEVTSSEHPEGYRLQAHAFDAFRLPDDSALAPGIHSYSAATPTSSFFVLSLMDLWRQHPMVKKIPNAAEMILGIGIHEFFHTFQGVALKAAVERVWKDGDAPNDDAVQKTLGEDPEYVAANTACADGLWASVREPNQKASRTALRATLSTCAKRTKLLQAKAPRLAVYEPLFVNVEGVAEFARYQALRQTATRAGSGSTELQALEPTFTGWSAVSQMTDDERIELMRSGRRKWSQDEGLVLMLLVDRHVDKWRGRILGDEIVDLRRLLRDHI